MTNIIMLGCNGRMGQMITDIVAKDDEAQIVAGIDIVNNRENPYPVFTDIKDCDVKADAIIDFSSANGFEERMDTQWTSRYLLLYAQQVCQMNSLIIPKKQVKK